VAATIVERWVTSLESAVAAGTVVVIVMAAAAAAAAAAIAITHTGAEAAGEAGLAPGRGLVQDLVLGEDATAVLLHDPAPGPSQRTTPSHARSLPSTAGSARAAVAGVNPLLASTRARRPQGPKAMLLLHHQRLKTGPLLLREKAALAEAHPLPTELQPTPADLKTFTSALYNHVLNNRWVECTQSEGAVSQSKQ